MITLPKINFMKRRQSSGLLGITLDGGRLEGVVLRRNNGGLQVQQSFSVMLSLDPLTNDPKLVGHEIRNHLDAAGVRERRCIAGVPLKWALTTHIKLPEIPDTDVANFLQIEAERGFSCDVTTLLLATVRYQILAGERHATLVGIPKNHLSLLEQSLRAAKLRPVSFSLGITALQPVGNETSDGVLALAIGESHVGLQVTCGGGVAALRTLEGALENGAGRRTLHADMVTRETRITLGQLPQELREKVRHIRIFGPRDLSQQLADEIHVRLEAMELKVELVANYSAAEFGFQLPTHATVSPAFSLAAIQLAGRNTLFEFLPPKVTAWQQASSRFSSEKLRTTGAIAGSLALLVVCLFLFQQWQLSRLRSQWALMEKTVVELDGLQQQIRRFRPWYDDSFRNLSILKQITEAFPEEGDVSAKTVEIRDSNTIVCTGIAQSNQPLLKTLERLRAAPNVADLKMGMVRVNLPCNSLSVFVGRREGKMKIKNRQEILMVVAFAAVALFSADGFIFSPLIQAWKSRSAQIIDLRKKVAQGAQLLQREQGIRNRWKQMRSSTLPSNTSPAEQQVLKAIDVWSRESRVSITSITPQWKHDADDFMTLECRVDASGNLATISRFLYNIEKDPTALKLDSVEIIARDNNGQEISLGLQISGLLLNLPGSQ